MITLRLARDTDAEAMLSIYAPFILNTAVTFECEVPSADAFAQRIRGIMEDYPYLSCEAGGTLIGYGCARRHMERAAYQWSAELSIYIARGWHRRGIGRTIQQALEAILRLQNVRTVVGGVTLPNPNSEGLIASLGFERIGTYRNAGFKRGQWHDVAWFQKAIGDYGPDPAPFLPFRLLPEEKVAEVLKGCNEGLRGV